MPRWKVSVAQSFRRDDKRHRTGLRFARQKFLRPFGVCASANHKVYRLASRAVARALWLFAPENVRQANAQLTAGPPKAIAARHGRRIVHPLSRRPRRFSES